MESKEEEPVIRRFFYMNGSVFVIVFVAELESRCSCVSAYRGLRFPRSVDMEERRDRDAC